MAKQDKNETDLAARQRKARIISSMLVGYHGRKYRTLCPCARVFGGCLRAGHLYQWKGGRRGIMRSLSARILDIDLENL